MDGATVPTALSPVASWEGAFSLAVRVKRDRPIFTLQVLIGWSEGTSVAYKKQMAQQFS